MKTLIAMTIIALGLSIGIATSFNAAGAKTWQEEAFEPKGD